MYDELILARDAYVVVGAIAACPVLSISHVFKLVLLIGLGLGGVWFKFCIANVNDIG